MAHPSYQYNITWLISLLLIGQKNYKGIHHWELNFTQQYLESNSHSVECLCSCLSCVEQKDSSYDVTQLQKVHCNLHEYSSLLMNKICCIEPRIKVLPRTTMLNKIVYIKVISY